MALNPVTYPLKSPAPRSTDTSSERKFAVTRSGAPSPLRSATATEIGPRPPDAHLLVTITVADALCTHP